MNTDLGNIIEIFLLPCIDVLVIVIPEHFLDILRKLMRKNIIDQILKLFLIKLEDKTGQQKKTFFENVLEFFIYSGAERYPKHDVTF